MLTHRALRTAVAAVVLSALSDASSLHAQDAAAAAAAGSRGCIAVMSATVTGVDGNAAAAGAAVRDVFIAYLTGPSMQPVALESRIQQLAVEEARQKNCTYVVTTSLSRKRGGGGAFGKALGRAAGAAAWYVPGGGTVGGAVARGVSVGAAQAIQDMTSSTRAKDEMRLDWTLTPLAAQESAPTSRNDKLKASADGEDLLTPLVQRAAEVIVQSVLK